MFLMTRHLVFIVTFAALLHTSRVSGGEIFGVRDDEYPAVVHLEISGDPRHVPGCCPRCSGVLVSLKYVATVATCLWSTQEFQPQPENIEVFAGTSEVSGKVFNGNSLHYGYGACSRSVQRVKALDVIYHKKFHPQFFILRHDVALVVIPRLQATRFVRPIEMSFDMFDQVSVANKDCKIVGFGIQKFPRAGYFSLFAWLQPMTRWERDVTVRNGCMGKPRDWNKRKWHAMIHGSLCSTVYSSETRVCWNDRGAALICNGYLTGLVQAQFEDNGKLDLTLRQCADVDTSDDTIKPTGRQQHGTRQQVIFLNMKYIAELIPEQMVRTKDLQWTCAIKDDANSSTNLTTTGRNMIQDLVVMINNTGNTSPTLSTQPSTKTVAQLPTWPSKPINPLQPALGQIKKTTTTERVAPTLWEMTELTLEQTTAEVRNPNVKNEMERVPVEEVIEDVVEEFANPPEWVKNRNAKKKTMPVLDFEPLRDVEFDELPEFGMDLKTSDQNVEANVDDTTNENNPFNKTLTQVHHLAIVLNTHTQRACSGVFITPQSILTAASCLVRQEENYMPLHSNVYRIITGHSNGLIDFCSDRIRTYPVQNITILNQGPRKPWQMYRKSHILPYTEIYNLAVVTIVGSHLSNESYAPIDYHTWDLLPLQQHLGEKPIALSTTLALGYLDGNSTSSQMEDTTPLPAHDDGIDSSTGSPPDSATMRCTMFGYGHFNFPYTNQRDRIGIKTLDLQITGNCTRPYYDFPFGEEPENLWLDVESPHFLCAINLNPSLGPGA
ncbi:uncharacterized protein LOC103511862, partial [Diaphorina citri]|uniref:Uncharacterized protein LOC103511862 n=1 Tax=Diaphorina citri TaxID=121845 RepID=A0A1S4EEX1_DIACI